MTDSDSTESHMLATKLVSEDEVFERTNLARTPSVFVGMIEGEAGGTRHCFGRFVMYVETGETELHLVDHCTSMEQLIHSVRVPSLRAIINMAPSAVEKHSEATDVTEFIAKLEKGVLGENMKRVRQELSRVVVDRAGRLTLKSLRLAAGLSQAQLADAVGTSQPRIARIEAGREEMGLNFARRLAEVLGVDVNTVAEAVNG